MGTLADGAETAARRALERFGVSAEARVERINDSENVTFRVSDPAEDRHYALRVGKPGYQTSAAVESELAWVDALIDSGAVETARPVAARDGRLVVVEWVAGEPTCVVLFEWCDGAAPDAYDAAVYRRLGAICGRMHAYARRWQRPAGFERPSWDADQFLGGAGRAGSWRAGVGVGVEERDLLGRAEETIRRRLEAYGCGRERFGLTHNDVRTANLLVDGERMVLIDFDDCGDSWFMADWATAVSGIEHDPGVPELQAAWVDGYRSVTELTRQDEVELATFVMMSRLFFVAHIGLNHHKAAEGSGSLLDPIFAEAWSDPDRYTADTCSLAESYLSAMGSARAGSRP
jgi:Ser/Thr protein kinase RdoA (MazF antagonist)